MPDADRAGEPATDSRVEKLAEHWQDPQCEARHFIHEFENAGLLVLDPKSSEAHEMLARLLHGGEWWDDPTYQGSATLRRVYLNEAAGLLQALYDIQQSDAAIEQGG